MRYRIALCGFSEFEYRAMHFSFQHPSAFHESAYDVVDALAEADFAIVDADSKPAVKGVVQSGRVGQAVFVGSSAPEGAAVHLPRPIDTTRILRQLDELTARHADAARRLARAVPPEAGALPTLDDVIAAPPVTQPGALSGTAEAAAEAATKKAAARAAARRARQASAQAAAAAAEPLRDVLVLDADPASSAPLCALLERFGFDPVTVNSMAAADAQIRQRRFAAIFLDMHLDSPGVALLESIRALPTSADHREPAVVLVAARVEPADRVRASLAGTGDPLIKPLSRGDVARALEARGVTLPADARGR